MISYEIKIDLGKLLHYSAPLRSHIDNETLLMIIRSFSVYLRDTYKSLIYDEIYSNRYKGEWEPILEEGYLEYLGTTPTQYILDLIYDALEIRESKSNIVIRIDPKYKYPNSKRSLIDVLVAIDNGTSKFNARPIIKKTVRQINSNIPRLWRMYLKKKGVN